MQPTQQRALITVALAAAFADGNQDERERDELRRVAEALALGPDINMAALVQDVLLKRVELDTLAAQLDTPELKQLALEFAVGVCDADGLRNAAETRFLADLGRALGLTQPQIAEPAAHTDAIATAPLTKPQTSGTDVSDAALDKIILDAAITNGALELLPQSLATMAILALQMRLVYRIGSAYGATMDRTHIKDFLATAGVGLTGQYLEQIGRGIVGGLFGAAAGDLIGALARGATGAAFSFATTYAIGQLARRYYAGGRVMSTDVLRQTYVELLAKAKDLQSGYRAQIEQRAASVAEQGVAALVRSG